jgi:hypothetical protein
MIATIIAFPVACISLGFLTLMAVPLAHVIAGKNTDFGFSVSISVSAVLSATTVLSATGFAYQARQARHHKRRARELEKRVKSQDES